MFSFAGDSLTDSQPALAGRVSVWYKPSIGLETEATPYTFRQVLLNALNLSNIPSARNLFLDFIPISV